MLVSRAGIEVEVFVEAPRFIIFGDDEQSAHSRNVSSLRRAAQGILKQAWERSCLLFKSIATSDGLHRKI